MEQIEKIAADFERFGVRPEARERFMPYLYALRNKDPKTFEHSVRVAYLCSSIADFTHLVPERTLWLPGLVHDVGKLLIRPETLTKTVGFDAQDMAQMRNHVGDGCRMLLGVADFSAFALFYHHYFKTREAYPSPEEFTIIFSDHFSGWREGTKTLAKYCGRLIALADFYDAITTRKNDKFSPGEARLPTAKESEKILAAENPDQGHLIGQLYEGGIFK